MNYISLFSGIGGIDLGLDRAGMTCIAQVEKDEFCRRVLAKHWPDVPKFDDVLTFGRSDIDGSVDLIAGGFPCQPHSYAGKRRGAADDRNLWPEYRRIVAEFRPRWVLGENVPGLRTTMLDEVLSDLEGMDYATRTISVPACAFDAPHIRERLFIVAYAEGDRRQRDRNIRQSLSPLSFGHDVNTKGPAMAHAQEQPVRAGLCQDEPRGQRGRRSSNGSGEGNISDANSAGLAQRQGQDATGSRTDSGTIAGGVTGWATEPNVGRVAARLPRWLDEPTGILRVASGIPDRVARLRALGNAVVPQVAEWLGRMIMQADRT